MNDKLDLIFYTTSSTVLGNNVLATIAKDNKLNIRSWALCTTIEHQN